MQDASSSKKQKHILIVDDNEDVRLLLQVILEEEGKYILSFAETGPEALAKGNQLQPDLIFMDMSLPQISGWEVVAQLRRQAAFAHLPIVAITAHASKADREHALAVGCDFYLSKPFDVVAILDVVERFLSNAPTLYNNNAAGD